MNKELKADWLPKLQARYLRRNREGKSRMLDELCADYHYERKYAIKLLSGGLARGLWKAPPGPGAAVWRDPGGAHAGSQRPNDGPAGYIRGC
jgi:hypothetical protein